MFNKKLKEKIWILEKEINGLKHRHGQLCKYLKLKEVWDYDYDKKSDTLHLLGIKYCKTGKTNDK